MRPLSFIDYITASSLGPGCILFEESGRLFVYCCYWRVLGLADRSLVLLLLFIWSINFDENYLLTWFDIYHYFTFLRWWLRSLRLAVIEQTSSLLNRFRRPWSLWHLTWLSCWSMTCLERSWMQTELICPGIHSDVARGSDGSSCLEVTGPFLEADRVSVWIIGSAVNNTHLQRSTWRCCGAFSHCGSEASYSPTSTWVLLVYLNKVCFRLVFSRPLARVECAILRKRSNQVITLDERALTSLTLWKLGSIFWGT